MSFDISVVTMSQAPTQDTQPRTPESKTRERPPNGAGIGIQIPSTHIPPSLTAPKFFPCGIVPKFLTCEFKQEFFFQEIEPEFFNWRISYGLDVSEIFPCGVEPKLLTGDG